MQTIADELNQNTQPTYEMEVIDPIGVDQPQPKLDFSFLTAQTGEGSIEDYLLHPLNFNESKGMARVLRGLTGMFGSLSYAIVDVIIGGLDLLKSNKKVGKNYDGGGIS